MIGIIEEIYPEDDYYSERKLFVGQRIRFDARDLVDGILRNADFYFVDIPPARHVDGVSLGGELRTRCFRVSESVLDTILGGIREE